MSNSAPRHESLNERLAEALKKEDFFECRSIITLEYPVALRKYFEEKLIACTSVIDDTGEELNENFAEDIEKEELIDEELNGELCNDAPIEELTEDEEKHEIHHEAKGDEYSEAEPKEESGEEGVNDELSDEELSEELSDENTNNLKSGGTDNFQSVAALYNLFSSIEKEEKIYINIADNIENWYKQNPNEFKADIITIIKIQVVVALLKYENDNNNYEKWAYTLFCEFVPKNICNPYFAVKKAIYSYINCPKNVKDSYFNEYKTYDNEKKQFVFKNFINKRITFNLFRVIKYNITKENPKTFFNKTYLNTAWLNAAKKNYVISLKEKFDIQSEIPIQKGSVNNNIENSFQSERVRIKFYALMLIPDKFKMLLWKYKDIPSDNNESGKEVDVDEEVDIEEDDIEEDVFTDDEFNEESDSTSKDDSIKKYNTKKSLVNRWRKNLNIYADVFEYFMYSNCKEKILKNFVENQKVFLIHLDKINLPSVIESEEPCFYYWELLAVQLINLKQNKIVTKKIEFEALFNKEKYSCQDIENIRKIKNKKFKYDLEWEESHFLLDNQSVKDKNNGLYTLPSLKQIFNDWDIFKAQCIFKVKAFSSQSKSDKIKFILKKLRKYKPDENFD